MFANCNHWWSSLCVYVGQIVQKRLWKSIRSQSPLPQHSHFGAHCHCHRSHQTGNHQKTKAPKMLLLSIKFQPAQPHVLSKTEIKEKRCRWDMHDIVISQIRFRHYLLSEQKIVRVNVQKPQQQTTQNCILPCWSSWQRQKRCSANVDAKPD